MKTAATTVISMGALALALHLPAGRWDWTAGWACWALVFLFSVAGGQLLARRDPALLERRSQIGGNTPLWDLGLLAALIVMMCCQMTMAGLERGRANLWPPVPVWWCGLALFLVGYAVTLKAMLNNTHFEPSVRLQQDRGHQLVDRGLYAHLRHPGYLGGILFFLSLSLLLGSLWSLQAWGAAVCLLVARMALEEDYLRTHLPGYADYCLRVRHRLLPGIW